MAEPINALIVEMMVLAPECKCPKASELQATIHKLPQAAKAGRSAAEVKIDALKTEVAALKLKFEYAGGAVVPPPASASAKEVRAGDSSSPRFSRFDDKRNYIFRPPNFDDGLMHRADGGSITGRLWKSADPCTSQSTSKSVNRDRGARPSYSDSRKPNRDMHRVSKSQRSRSV